MGSWSFIEDILMDYDVDMMTSMGRASSSKLANSHCTDLAGLEADLLAEHTDCLKVNHEL